MATSWGFFMGTTSAGVVSGLNRAIPSPVGTTIRGAIQARPAAGSLLPLSLPAGKQGLACEGVEGARA